MLCTIFTKPRQNSSNRSPRLHGACFLVMTTCLWSFTHYKYLRYAFPSRQCDAFAKTRPNRQQQRHNGVGVCVRSRAVCIVCVCVYVHICSSCVSTMDSIASRACKRVTMQQICRGDAISTTEPPNQMQNTDTERTYKPTFARDERMPREVPRLSVWLSPACLRLITMLSGPCDRADGSVQCGTSPTTLRRTLDIKCGIYLGTCATYCMYMYMWRLATSLIELSVSCVCGE